MRRIGPAALLLAAALLSLAGCARRGADADARLAARVDSLVAEYQRDTWAPGVSVAVVRGGRDTLVYRGYGLADVENGVPATPRTVYRIGSVSNQFTTALVLRLAEQKRCRWTIPSGATSWGCPRRGGASAFGTC